MRAAAAGPWTLDVPIGHPQQLMTANQRRGHWGGRHKATKTWRQLAGVQAHNAVVRGDIPRNLTGVHLVMTFAWPDQRRRDVANLAPTAKALVDGLVDAKVLVDDSDRHITGPDLRRAVGPHAITVTITRWEGLW